MLPKTRCRIRGTLPIRAPAMCGQHETRCSTRNVRKLRMTATIVRRPADQHLTTVHKPADFVELWRQGVAVADAIPIHFSMVSIPLRSTVAVETFEIQSDSLDGVRVSGWYCRPR